MLYAENSLQTADVQLHYVEGENTGPPMIWLHGVAGRWQRWRRHMAVFQPNFQQFAIDARGHGESSRTPGRYTWVDHANDLTSFLEQKIDRPAVLIGHSQGAMQALYAAANHPSKVAALVLEDPPLFNAKQVDPDTSAFQFLLGMIESGIPEHEVANVFGAERWVTDELSHEYAQALSRLDPDTLRQIINQEATKNYSVKDYLVNINCPVLVLCATKAGAVLTESNQKFLGKILPDASLIKVRDSGHLIHAEQPEEYIRYLRDFAKENFRGRS